MSFGTVLENQRTTLPRQDCLEKECYINFTLLSQQLVYAYPRQNLMMVMSFALESERPQS